MALPTELYTILSIYTQYIHTHTAVRSTIYYTYRIHSKCMRFPIGFYQNRADGVCDMVSFPLLFYFIIYTYIMSTLSSGCWVLLLDSNNIACFIPHVIHVMHSIWSFLYEFYAYASLSFVSDARMTSFSFLLLLLL